MREQTASKTDQHLTPEEQAVLMSLGYVAGGEGGPALEEAKRPQDMIYAEAEIASVGQAVMRQDWAYVKAACEYVLERDPSNKYALTNTALASLNQGRAEEALAPSKRLVEVYPKNPNSYATHGRALSEAGRPGEAYAVLLGARDFIEDSEAVGYFLLVAGFDAGEPVCDELVETVLQEFPRSGRTYVMKSRCDLRGDGGLSAAFNTLSTAVLLGYREIEALKHFDEFAKLVADPRFQGLVDLQNPDAAKTDTFAETSAES